MVINHGSKGYVHPKQSHGCDSQQKDLTILYVLVHIPFFCMKNNPQFISLTFV